MYRTLNQINKNLLSQANIKKQKNCSFSGHVILFLTSIKNYLKYFSYLHWILLRKLHKVNFPKENRFQQVHEQN